jgi:hypothetical protein
MPKPKPVLAANHLKMLRKESGISDEVIAARGYQTVTDAALLKELGFAPRQCIVPGLLIPIYTPDGGNGLYRYRPDNPRFAQEKHESRQIKYEQPKGLHLRIDCPPTCRPMLADPKIPLWITEGEKKGDALASQGKCVIDLPGVWGFITTNTNGGKTFNETDMGFIAFNGRLVPIVFDSDVMVKPQVRQALDRLTSYIERKGGHVVSVYLPQVDGHKVGVDDYLASGHTIADLEALVEAPRPRPTAAAPMVRLLDDAPLTIRRPLSIIGEHSYAAAWIYIEKTETEGMDKSGNIVYYNPARVTNEKALFIVRDDGRIYGPGADDPIDALGVTVYLPEAPFPDHLWRKASVLAYHGGARPAADDVFGRIHDCILRFMDFDSSLGDPGAMCDLVACYIIATWFLDAFNVIGFLWPNGTAGSGKTKLITLVSLLSHLGILILSVGSMPSLRDMADYGATMAFDDCESMSNPKTSDPDKRNLLLAGNRRGNFIPLKDFDPITQKWHTRLVNTFCPRIFSATNLPDPILETRTIVIPLVKSADSSKANADVFDFTLWPADRKTIIDDLWALSCANLLQVKAIAADYNTRSLLVGRDLEPWRAILTIATWLDGQGVPGLRARMEALAIGYQTERPELSSPDPLSLTLRAIKTLTAGTLPPWRLSTASVSEQIKQLIADEEIDFNAQWVTGHKVGHWMRKHRFKKDPDHRLRTWVIDRQTFERRLKAYRLENAQNEQK